MLILKSKFGSIIYKNEVLVKKSLYVNFLGDEGCLFFYLVYN